MSNDPNVARYKAMIQAAADDLCPGVERSGGPPPR
jgi:hypothetical protein